MSVELNLIEHLWKKGRPVARDEPLTVHPLEYAGERHLSLISLIDLSDRFYPIPTDPPHRPPTMTPTAGVLLA